MVFVVCLMKRKKNDEGRGAFYSFGFMILKSKGYIVIMRDWALVREGFNM